MGPRLSPKLIQNSDLIFEGKLVKADTFQRPGEDSSAFTFTVGHVYKGEPAKKVIVHSGISSCGLLLFTCSKEEFREILGKRYIVYCRKEEGKYTWTYCRDRIAYSIDPDPADWHSKKERKRKDEEFRTNYRKELVTLDSLIKAK